MSSFLSPEEVKSFKEIVFNVYGKKLTDEEAYEQGSRLIRLFELMIRQKKAQEGLLKLS